MTAEKETQSLGAAGSDTSAEIDASDPALHGQPPAVWELYREIGKRLGGGDREFLSKAWSLAAWRRPAVALLRARAESLGGELACTLKTLGALRALLNEGGETDG